MRSNAKKTFYYHADANSLGGFVEKPFSKSIPTQSSASLPQVGGVTTNRTEAFNFEELISCSSAYTRVSGREMGPDGPWSVTATAVVEGLKILEVLTADRLVVQVSVEYPRDGGDISVSLAGSSFEGIRLGGCNAPLITNPNLLCGAKTAITYPTFLREGREQADNLVKGVKADKSGDDREWLVERFGWMASNQKQEEGQCILASLVNGVSQPIPGISIGHAVEIPDFGRLFLGELLVCQSSIQVSSFRAELGCGTHAQVNGPTARVRGGTIPPS
jgi:hypothetical protein